MSREIKSVKDAELIDSVERPNNYRERLVKLIPSEIISVYITINGLILSLDDNIKDSISWISMLILIVITPFYLFRISGVTKRNQILFSTISLIIWVFATAPPAISDYPENVLKIIASTVLALQTLFIPFFYKG
ncbi:hypothetical protein [Flavobacterium sp.]|uniref:hypothetical protein n=1 Tax=Flavobacterium sp. TaxID=239 RepID=UPI003D6BCB0F